uniref:Protein PTHB1 n=1 Tax=Panagrellus redivivus TaxID=6233 RepID=A0A7E4VZD8_PANRE
MSLFHFQEWFHTVVDEARTLTTGVLLDDTSQLVIGTLDGLLCLLDPGRDVDNRHEASSLMEIHLDQPIIQLAIGNFVSSQGDNVLAVLHPKLLVFYRVSKDGPETCKLEKLIEHRIKGQPAYNMCPVKFEKSEVTQICVQTINCALHFFESENHLLTREAFQQIHPGPIAFHPSVESVLTSAGGVLSSVKFSSLASMPKTGKGAKMMRDWELNIGDTPVAIEAISSPDVQPSIAICARRALHCLTSGGNLRYTIRLESAAMSMHVHTNGANIHYIIASHVKTLLFYKDTEMIWTSQLSFIPMEVKTGNYGDGFRGMLTLLSDDCRVSVGYLGTEPSLFRMPVTDSRFIDFEARQKELNEYEASISANSKTDMPEKEPETLIVETEINMDSQSNAIDTDESVSSMTLKVICSGVFNSAEVFIENELGVVQIGSEPNLEGSGAAASKVYSYTMFAERAVYDNRMTVVTVADGKDTVLKNLKLPLKVICEEAAAQKTALHKFSIDSSEPGLELTLLFPEFQPENQTAMGLRPYYVSETVSIFVSQKTNRYRVQSDNPISCFVIIDELVTRIRAHQPNVKLTASAVPMQLFIKSIAEFLDVERKREIEEGKTQKLTIMMRHVEMVLLQKLKSEFDQPPQHVNFLVNHTYRELLMSLDRLIALDNRVNPEGSRSFRAQLNLFTLLLSLADVDLPFDGRILDGTYQKLTERLSALFTSSTLSSNPEPAEVCRLIVNYCERGGRLGGITEEDEEEEEAEQEQHLPDEFVELKSGTLPVKF